MRKVSGIALTLIVVAGVACAAKRVLVPARMDLHPFGRIGLVTFTVENAKGNLHQFATERFAENVLSAQPAAPSSAIEAVVTTSEARDLALTK